MRNSPVKLAYEEHRRSPLDYRAIARDNWASLASIAIGVAVLMYEAWCLVLLHFRAAEVAQGLALALILIDMPGVLVASAFAIVGYLRDENRSFKRLAVVLIYLGLFGVVLSFVLLILQH